MTVSYDELMKKIDELKRYSAVSLNTSVTCDTLSITFFSRYYSGADLKGTRYCGFVMIKPAEDQGYYKVCFSDSFGATIIISDHMSADDIIATIAGIFVYIEHTGCINHAIGKVNNNGIYKKLAGLPRNAPTEFHKQLKALR